MANREIIKSENTSYCQSYWSMTPDRLALSSCRETHDAPALSPPFVCRGGLTHHPGERVRMPQIHFPVVNNQPTTTRRIYFGIVEANLAATGTSNAEPVLVFADSLEDACDEAFLLGLDMDVPW